MSCLFDVFDSILDKDVTLFLHPDQYHGNKDNKATQANTRASSYPRVGASAIKHPLFMKDWRRLKKIHANLPAVTWTKEKSKRRIFSRIIFLITNQQQWHDMEASLYLWGNYADLHLIHWIYILLFITILDCLGERCESLLLEVEAIC